MQAVQAIASASVPSPRGSTYVLAAGVPDWFRENAAAIIGGAVRIVLVVVVAFVVRKLAQRAIALVVNRVLEGGERRGTRGNGRAVQRREQRARTIGAVLGSMATIVITAMALAMVLGQLGIELGPLLAGAGVVGLAIGFGAQNLVADYLSGLLIMVEDQYGVGDSVDLGEAIGTVEHVGLRLTQVRDLNGGLWHIRNGEILRVRNDSQDWARAVLDVSVTHEASLDTVHEVLERTGRELHQDPDHGPALLEVPQVWGVQSLDPDSVVVRMVVKTQPLKQWGITRELRRRVKENLDAAGVEIPTQQRTVWLRGGDLENGTPGTRGGRRIGVEQ